MFTSLLGKPKVIPITILLATIYVFSKKMPLINWQHCEWLLMCMHPNALITTQSNLVSAHYLYGVCRFLSVLFKQQHGRSVHVDAELLLDTRRLTLIYVPKPHKVPICKCRDLQTDQHNKVFPAHKLVTCIL